MHTASATKPFFRHPLFWTVFIALSLSASLFAYYYFAKAFPIVDIALTMNRSQALEKAREIAQKYQLGPQKSDAAALFYSEDMVQTYIEIERGGFTAWKEFIKTEEFYPFGWAVRHFNEGQTHELYIKFTPQGAPYSFIEIIPETQPGAHPPEKEAHEIAQKFAAEWGLDLSSYKLVDSGREVKINGRVDHKFIYEKELNNLGDAHYRVNISTTGDKVTQLNHYIDVPEAFIRKYANMRTLNDTLKSFASIIVRLIYLLTGCLLGILYLLKRRYLLAKPAVYVGIGFGVLQLLVSLNHLPLDVFYFDTALSRETQIFKLILDALTSFITWSAIYCITFLAAEGLTRRAFGSHIQLWSAWKLPAAASYTMLGKTIGSYFYVAIALAYVFLFYALGRNLFGWWVPSSPLADPNILAEYFPPLTAIGRSIHAGFWEECLFRAVPIASCALLGRKLGNKNLGIFIGLILQAIVFGAAHADYPVMPFYVRVVEMFPESMIWGIIYILLGLIPGILIHIFYDLLLFSIPIFVSTAPGMWFQKAFILCVAALPLLYILISRIRTKKWIEVPKEFTNESWQPVEGTIPLETELSISHKEPRFSWPILIGSLAVGLTGFLFLRERESTIPPLTITKTEATDIATNAVMKRGPLNPEWYIITTVAELPMGQQSLFVWREEGPQKYKELMGSYLAKPGWYTRFAQFTGDLTQRAEEYRVYVDGSGKEVLVSHILPQTAARPPFDEQKARAAALEKLSMFNLKPDDVKEISAFSDTLPQRTDRTFIFADKHQELTSGKGQARISMTYAGDELVAYDRYVHIPDEWLRKQRNQQALVGNIDEVRNLGWYILVILAALLGAFMWRNHSFSVKAALISAGIYFVISYLATLANLSATLANLRTAESFFTQLITILALKASRAAMSAILIGIFVGLVYKANRSKTPFTIEKLFAALAAGCLWFSLDRFIWSYVFSSAPWYPPLTGADSYLPWLVYTKSTFDFLLWQILPIQILILLSGKTRLRSAVALVIATLLLAPINGVETVGQWVIVLALGALLFAFIYRFMLRSEPSLVPLAFATTFVLFTIQDALYAMFPGEYTALALSGLAVVAYAIGWLWLSRPKYHET